VPCKKALTAMWRRNASFLIAPLHLFSNGSDAFIIHDSLKGRVILKFKYPHEKLVMLLAVKLLSLKTTYVWIKNRYHNWNRSI